MAAVKEMHLILHDWPKIARENFHYEMQTSMGKFFDLADALGIRHTEKELSDSFAKCRYDYKALTEYILLTNWKSWQWADENEELAELYLRYNEKATAWAYDNFTIAEQAYLFDITD